jgi:UDP-GlcNAc:undecaprenyl-phosphate GlcNAc-1-phosphate transferase
MTVAAAALLPFLLALGLTPALGAVARRTGLVAAPRADRWHRRPTALLGGVAIYLAFLAAFLFHHPALGRAYPVVVASTFLFLVGLLDDVVRIRPAAKLAAQVAAALVVVASGLRLPWTASVVVNDAITVFWLVGITNALNLLDNMDGLAAGIAGIASAFLAVTFVLNGQHEVAPLPLLLGGAAIGFLVFNRKPATIFMGDSGSMFLGSSLGGIALLSEYGRTRNLTSVLLTPVLIMAIPILDTCLVTVTRRLAGRPVSQGGRDHTSHRLVARGLTEHGAVGLLYLIAALSGSFALLARWLEEDVLLALLPVPVLAVLAFAVWVGRARVGHEPAAPPMRVSDSRA